MWSKLDDQFYLNPKNAVMDRDEQDLYIAGIIYCNGQLTDGFIPASVLFMLCAWAKIPLEANAKANAEAIASRLVKHNFWELVDGGYSVHDFLDWNMSRAEVTALKQARSEAGRRGGSKSQAQRKAIASANAKQNSTQSQSLLIKQIEEMTGGDPLTEAFTKATNIIPYDLEKWVQASQDMTNAGVTADEIPIALKKMDDDEMQYSGLWSIVKTAIWVHLRRQSNKPIFSGNGRKGKPSTPDRQPTETWT